MEEYGYTLLPNIEDNPEMGNPLSSGAEGGFAAEGDDDQKGGYSGAVAGLEVAAGPGWQDWKINWGLDQFQEISI